MCKSAHSIGVNNATRWQSDTLSGLLQAMKPPCAKQKSEVLPHSQVVGGEGSGALKSEAQLDLKVRICQLLISGGGGGG